MNTHFHSNNDYSEYCLGSLNGGDAGAAKTVPVKASSLRKKGVVVLKGRPCKIANLSTCVNGKHGTSKVSVVSSLPRVRVSICQPSVALL